MNTGPQMEESAVALTLWIGSDVTGDFVTGRVAYGAAGEADKTGTS